PAVRTLTLVSAPTAGGPSASQFVQGSVLWNRSAGRLTYAPGPSLQRAGLPRRAFVDEDGDARRAAGRPGVRGVRAPVGTSRAPSPDAARSGGGGSCDARTDRSAQRRASQLRDVVGRSLLRAGRQAGTVRPDGGSARARCVERDGAAAARDSRADVDRRRRLGPGRPAHAEAIGRRRSASPATWGITRSASATS